MGEFTREEVVKMLSERDRLRMNEVTPLFVRTNSLGQEGARVGFEESRPYIKRFNRAYRTLVDAEAAGSATIAYPALNEDGSVAGMEKMAIADYRRMVFVQRVTLDKIGQGDWAARIMAFHDRKVTPR